MSHQHFRAELVYQSSQYIIRTNNRGKFLIEQIDLDSGEISSFNMYEYDTFKEAYSDLWKKIKDEE